MSTTDVRDIPLVSKLLSKPDVPSPKSQAIEAAWLERASKLTPPKPKDLEAPLAELDSYLTLRSYMCDYHLTKVDLIVWGTLKSNGVASNLIKQGIRVNVTRWFNFIDESNPWITESANEVVQSRIKITKDEKPTDDGPNYELGLQDTSKGVVTRFPPEPSGFLHIGHAKAALLNDYFAHKKYKGTLILRFDDTNPSKETQEFQDSIVEDLAMLGVSPDKTSHTSDYFQQLHDYCVQMIDEGNAYADDTEQEILRKERMAGVPSKRRDYPPQDSLAKFKEMKAGSEEGKRWFIRAKISPDDPNGALRDPVIYRCNPRPHHRTGDTWKIYPTYDFCCPIVDALEGVTHALRTTEYKDRDAQYQWMIKALRIRNVYNWDFARMNFIRTLLSKRKLTQFVENGTVWGWNDPRMPTVRGIRRRGMTIEALQEFILSQGPSKNIVNLDWSLFWATNKKYIDPISARYTAVAEPDMVTAVVQGARAAPYYDDKPFHVKYPLGMKKVYYSQSIVLEQVDAASFAQDEEITLMNWGNAIVRKISHSMLGTGKNVTGLELELHLQGDVKKTKKKVQWLSKDQELIPCELYDFDYLITKDKLEEGDNVDDFLTKQTLFKTDAKADCNVAALEENAIMQFDRKGYYRVDRPFRHNKAAVFFHIPTGK